MFDIFSSSSFFPTPFPPYHHEHLFEHLFIASNSTTPCGACVGGSFQDLDPATSYNCKSCGPGTSAPGSLSTCSECAVGKFQEQSKATSYGCKFCSIGKEFVDSSNLCSDCIAGKYHHQNDQVSAVCKTCSPGSAPLNAASSCSDCTNGQISFPASLYGCKSCNEGKVAADSSSLCEQPKNGKIQPNNLATAYASDGTRDCQAGTTSTDALACEICPAGKFAFFPGSPKCKDCIIANQEYSGEFLHFVPFLHFSVHVLLSYFLTSTCVCSSLAPTKMLLEVFLVKFAPMEPLPLVKFARTFQ